MRYVLGIETSCDDSGAAIAAVAGSGDVSLVSEVVSSQTSMHELYGGVVPELAAREHLRNLPVIVAECLRRGNVTSADLDAVGVTRGPGLKGCLLIGLNFAKAFAVARGLPLVAVNHIEGHIFSVQLDHPDLQPPFLALVVSGGHTEIHLVHRFGEYQLIARTIDDAAGEAFDKSANLLGFNYPGGAALADLADSVESSDFNLPRVMRKAEGFSFSGLKTAIAVLIREQAACLRDEQMRAKIAYAIQDSIVDALLYKLKQAVAKTGIRKVAVAGGVSANKFLRRKLASWRQVDSYFPELRHCVDNGANTAYLAACRLSREEFSPLNVAALSRWPVESISCE